MGLIIHIDGGSRGNPGPAGAGVVIHDENGTRIHEAAHFLGRQTSNAAEYLALIYALQRAGQCAEQTICIYSDSQLLVRQITGEYRVKSPSLAQLHEQVQMLLLRIPSWIVQHIPREQNRQADKLANLAMDRQESAIVFDIEASGAASPLETAREPTESAESDTPADRRAEHGLVRAVRVVVTAMPKADACPAGGCLQETFSVAETLPGGLCVHAAHALLPTILAMLNTAPHEYAAIPTMTVRCTRPQCGATFQLSPVRSGNGAARRDED